MVHVNPTLQEIREFLEAHPQGWGHEDWQAFLDYLASIGYDTSDPDGIGLALEQERVRRTLRGAELRGLGPKRIEAVADEYANLHDLQQAPGDEIARKAGIPQALAERIAEVL